MKYATLALALLLSPLSAGASNAVPQVHLSLTPNQQRSVGAKTWHIPVLQFAVSTRKNADIRSVFFSIEGQSRKGRTLEQSFTSMIAEAELSNAATGRKVPATIVDERVKGSSRFVAVRVDDVMFTDNDRWQLRVKLKGSTNIDWLRGAVCGSMAEASDPCVSSDGGSQFQPWVQDLETGNDIALSPTLLKGRPVILRGKQQ